MTEFAFLTDLIFLFGVGIVAVLFFHRANLPPIVGFLITGILVGPHGLDFIDQTKNIEILAEIGVMLLLFSVGIEISLKRLVALRKFLFVAGFFQVGLLVLVVAVAARVLGLNWPSSIFLGMLLSLSSTALVLRYMADRGEIDSLHGKTSMCLLVFQDLIIIPMILLTPYLGSGGDQLVSIGYSLFKSVLLLFGSLISARFVVPWLLHQVVKTRNREAFLLMLIFLCLGTAWLTAQAGLSLTLGAFIAGLVISESDYSLQAFSEILPLREVFNSLFFVSIGMLFNPYLLLQSPELLLGGIVAVIVLKCLVTGCVTYFHGYSLRVSLLTGLALAQVGEFSFVLSKVGVDSGVLLPSHEDLFIGVAIGTMLATPLLRSLWPTMANWFDQKFTHRWHRGRYSEVLDDGVDQFKDHVVVVGYGPNGRHLTRVLQQVKIEHVVIEMNPDTVKKEKNKGVPILYGDAAHPQVLKRAGIDRARLFVIAIPDQAATRRLINIIRELNPHVYIIVRTNYYRDLPELSRLGADEVISQEFETSIEIFSRALQRYLVPREEIESCVKQARADRYQMLRMPISAHQPIKELDRILSDLSLEVIRVPSDSKFVGQTLQEVDLKVHTGVNIVAIQSEDKSILTNPNPDAQLRKNDIVLLVGKASELELARKYFEKNKNS